MADALTEEILNRVSRFLDGATDIQISTDNVGAKRVVVARKIVGLEHNGEMLLTIRVTKPSLKTSPEEAVNKMCLAQGNFRRVTEEDIAFVDDSGVVHLKG